MKFLTSESTVETGNGQMSLRVLPHKFHILSYVNNEFLLSEVDEVEELIIEDETEIVKIDDFDISFSSNYPIVVKNEEDEIILAAVKPENDTVVTFDVNIHRIFDGQDWRKISGVKLYQYTGYAYNVTVKDDYFFLKTVLLSSK